jgi:2-oxo-4-hydroxy-4-carboxy--5-ureidoimidazoline (OHCU) decarboxylase
MTGAKRLRITRRSAIATRCASGSQRPTNNRVYEHKFGYIFIVCASGRNAEQMLALLRQRLANDPADELRIAAEEQAKITSIRLSAIA